VLDKSRPPSVLPNIYLRRSCPYDVTTPEGLKEGMRGMFGVLRYIVSGEAEVTRMREGLKRNG
jgi:hypothetical protein